ncbi:MAG: type II toxin-antitoxin system Phd/YefM family antitoxin [Verrucomicrobia bacterium]|nr:MAG: type II toxin-antitoxin system Phd/YefM family antitoxin [Verrucomicrobiota bacterium]
MKTATIRQAQHHLSKLVDEVIETGDGVVLTRRGKEVCKIIPMAPLVLEKVDWKKIVSGMDEWIEEMPKFDHGVVEKLREEERF